MRVSTRGQVMLNRANLVQQPERAKFMGRRRSK